MRLIVRVSSELLLKISFEGNLCAFAENNAVSENLLLSIERLLEMVKSTLKELLSFELSNLAIVLM